MGRSFLQTFGIALHFIRFKADTNKIIQHFHALYRILCRHIELSEINNKEKSDEESCLDLSLIPTDIIKEKQSQEHVRDIPLACLARISQKCNQSFVYACCRNILFWSGRQLHSQNQGDLSTAVEENAETLKTNEECCTETPKPQGNVDDFETHINLIDDRQKIAWLAESNGLEEEVVGMVLTIIADEEKSPQSVEVDNRVMNVMLKEKEVYDIGRTFGQENAGRCQRILEESYLSAVKPETEYASPIVLVPKKRWI